MKVNNTFSPIEAHSCAKCVRYRPLFGALEWGYCGLYKKPTETYAKHASWGCNYHSDIERHIVHRQQRKKSDKALEQLTL